MDTDMIWPNIINKSFDNGITINLEFFQPNQYNLTSGRSINLSFRLNSNHINA